MNKTDRYYIVVSHNGFRWLFPKESYYSEVNHVSFMTIKELEDISKGIVPEKWKLQ